MIDALTVTEFARRHGVSRTVVYRWMRKTPNLHPQRVGGLTLLSAQDQRRILGRPRTPGGRPKKPVDKASHAA